MKDKTPLVGLVILLSFCSGLRLERKKEEEVEKDVRGLEEERRRGKEEERKKCCLIVPYSASQTIQEKRPCEGTSLSFKLLWLAGWPLLGWLAAAWLAGRCL